METLFVSFTAVDADAAEAIREASERVGGSSDFQTSERDGWLGDATVWVTFGTAVLQALKLMLDVARPLAERGRVTKISIPDVIEIENPTAADIERAWAFAQAKLRSGS